MIDYANCRIWLFFKLKHGIFFKVDVPASEMVKCLKNKEVFILRLLSKTTIGKHNEGLNEARNRPALYTHPFIRDCFDVINENSSKISERESFKSFFRLFIYIPETKAQRLKSWSVKTLPRLKITINCYLVHPNVDEFYIYDDKRYSLWMDHDNTRFLYTLAKTKHCN